jgi:hypothetical protein
MRTILRRRPMRRLAVGLMAGVLAGGLALPSSPAGADVNDVSGAGAFGVFFEANVINVIQIGPETLVEVELPGGGGGPFTAQLLSVELPPGTGVVLDAGLVTASTTGGNLGTHQGFSQSSASIAEATVLSAVPGGLLEAGLIQSSCTSNGDGSTGTASFVDLAIVGQSVINGEVPPNTVITIPGVGTITLNEQIVTNTPGVETAITVNAIHIEVDTAVVTAELILSQSRCRAAGPDVLIPEPTPTAPATPTVVTPRFTG